LAAPIVSGFLLVEDQMGDEGIGLKREAKKTKPSSHKAAE
jgi:hypothetical protein